MYSPPVRFFQIAAMVALCACPAFGQKMVVNKKLPPAALTPDAFLVLDSVVTEQWPVLPGLVNPPHSMTLLNPGQCVRVAVVASGDGSARFLDGASIAWTVTVGGKATDFASAPLGASKQMKPDGADFVLGALAAAGIKGNPIAQLADTTMAVTPGRWCVPQGAGDGDAEVRVVVRRQGQDTALNVAHVAIESLSTAAGKTFASLEDLSKFSKEYHEAPEPGRLMPAMAYVVTSKMETLIPYAFLRAAFVHDAATVQGFGPELGAADKLTEMLALNLLSKVGVALADPPRLSAEDKQNIAEAADLPNAYDMQPTEDLFTKLDFLWAEFSANGEMRPVKAVTSALAWRADYDAFEAMKKAGRKPAGVTPSLVRGITYMAAGWSLNSFDQDDPLAADYLAVILNDPGTPAVVKRELAGMTMNPAFKRVE